MAKILEILDEIRVERSELDTWRKCPLRASLDREAASRPVDADRRRAARRGTAFHTIAGEWLAEWIAVGSASPDPDALVDLAMLGPAEFQPDLVTLAKFAGPRCRRLWLSAYISHEQQYTARLDKFGPQGQAVALTIRPDVLLHGDRPGVYWAPDFKTGWGEAGFEFQAMFTATVLSYAIEDCQRVIWQPLLVDRGRWGEPIIFDVDARGPLAISIDEARHIIESAARAYLVDQAAGLTSPTPGSTRCAWCDHVTTCPVGADFAEIDADPAGYLRAFMHVEAERSAMAARLKTYAEANGPIEIDGKWYGLGVLSTRPTYGLRDGVPDQLNAGDVPARKKESKQCPRKPKNAAATKRQRAAELKAQEKESARLAAKRPAAKKPSKKRPSRKPRAASKKRHKLAVAAPPRKRLSRSRPSSPDKSTTSGTSATRSSAGTMSSRRAARPSAKRSKKRGKSSTR